VIQGLRWQVFDGPWNWHNSCITGFMYAALIILRTHYSEFTEWFCGLSRSCWHFMIEPREVGAVAIRSEAS